MWTAQIKYCCFSLWIVINLWFDFYIIQFPKIRCTNLSAIWVLWDCIKHYRKRYFYKVSMLLLHHHREKIQTFVICKQCLSNIFDTWIATSSEAAKWSGVKLWHRKISFPSLLCNPFYLALHKDFSFLFHPFTKFCIVLGGFVYKIMFILFNRPQAMWAPN